MKFNIFSFVLSSEREGKYRHAVSSVLAKNIQLAFEILGVECAATRGIALAVGRAQDDERLKNSRLLARSGRAEDGAVRGHLSPAQHAEAELVGEFAALFFSDGSLLRPVGLVANEDLVYAFGGMLFDVCVPGADVLKKTA